jgi:hypothetical protein
MRREAAMVRLVVAFCLLAAGALGAPGGLCAQAVDLELVLSVDSSGSIDSDEFALQREGYARALTHPEVLKAIASGPNKAIAIVFIEWSGPGIATRVIEWTRIAGKEDAEAAAGLLLTAPRTIFGGGTSLGAAIEDGIAALEGNAFQGRRQVIDISGDGFNNRGIAPEDARVEAVRRGITINGLAVDEFGGALEAYFRAAVIAGPGAFAISATSFEDFHRAVVRKLLREIFISRSVAPCRASTPRSS